MNLQKQIRRVLLAACQPVRARSGRAVVLRLSRSAAAQVSRFGSAPSFQSWALAPRSALAGKQPVAPSELLPKISVASATPPASRRLDWQPEADAELSDAITLVRRQIWKNWVLESPRYTTAFQKLTPNEQRSILNLVTQAL